MPRGVFDLRTVGGQGRLRGHTCPPNRQTNTLRTASGQFREKGHQCDPTIGEHNRLEAKKKKVKKIMKRKKKEDMNAETEPPTDDEEEEKKAEPMPKPKSNKELNKVLKEFKLTKPQIKEIKSTIEVKDFANIDKAKIRLALQHNTLFEICNKTIGKGFIRSIVSNPAMKGLIIFYKDTPISFVFFRTGFDNFHIELICAKKAPGTLKGVPIGRITILLAENAIKKANKKLKGANKRERITLDSVPSAIKFYESLGYKKTGQKDSEGLPIMEKKL